MYKYYFGKLIKYGFLSIIVLIVVYSIINQENNRSSKSHSSVNKLTNKIASNEIKNIKHYGKEFHRESSGKSYHIFFQTSFKDRDTLDMIVNYFKKKNKSFTFRVLFFDSIPENVKFGYPMSKKLKVHWIAEFIYNERSRTDSLFFVEH